MRLQTRISYSLCDRITASARGARQEDTGLTRRGLSTPPRKRARWGPRLCRDINVRALAWLDPALGRISLKMRPTYTETPRTTSRSGVKDPPKTRRILPCHPPG